MSIYILDIKKPEVKDFMKQEGIREEELIKKKLKDFQDPMFSEETQNIRFKYFKTSQQKISERFEIFSMNLPKKTENKEGEIKENILKKKLEKIDKIVNEIRGGSVRNLGKIKNLKIGTRTKKLLLRSKIKKNKHIEILMKIEFENEQRLKNLEKIYEEGGVKELEKDYKGIQRYLSKIKMIKDKVSERNPKNSEFLSGRVAEDRTKNEKLKEEGCLGKVVKVNSLKFEGDFVEGLKKNRSGSLWNNEDHFFSPRVRGTTKNNKEYMADFERKQLDRLIINTRLSRNKLKLVKGI